jgi:fatty-acyl-CoA synthase
LITPTRSGIPRKTDFDTLAAALDYAAEAATGFTFYSSRGEPLQALSYAEMRDRVEARARRLAGLGLATGDRVAMIGETTPDFVIAFLAAVRARVVPVPLPVAGVFAEPARYSGQIARQLAGCGARLFLRPDGASLLPEGSEVAELSWSELAAAPEGDVPPEAPRPDDLCYLQYSSGSTRFPRGVAVTHRALMRNCGDIAGAAIGAEPDDRIVSWLPLYHDMGLVGTMLAPIAAQASVDFISTDTFARRPMVWLQLISRNRGTVAYAPCFGYDLCRRRANATQIAELDLSSWRVAGVGAEMIDPQVIERFCEAFAPAGFRGERDPCKLRPRRGDARRHLRPARVAGSRPIASTPKSSAAIAAPSCRTILPRAASCAADGRCRVSSVEIRGPKGETLPPRVAGRVVIRGASVMQGYFNDPEATAEAFDPRRLARHRRRRLHGRGRSRHRRPCQGHDHRQRPQRLAAGSRVDGRADPAVRNQSCAAFGVFDPGKGERAVVLVQSGLRDPRGSFCALRRGPSATSFRRQASTAASYSCRRTACRGRRRAS